MKFSTVLLPLALATPLLASPVTVESRQPVAELTSRNPEFAALSKLLEKRQLGGLLPCLPLCMFFDTVCRSVAGVIAVVGNVDFQALDDAGCVPRYCQCLAACGEDIEFYCYKEFGGPFDNAPENCSEDCCKDDGSCPPPQVEEPEPTPPGCCTCSARFLGVCTGGPPCDRESDVTCGPST